MRTLWNILSFLAVVNLLALVAFIGWLWQSDRLSPERIEQIRAMLSLTVAEQQQQALKAEQAAQAERAEQREQARRTDPPLPAAHQVAAVNLVREQQQRAIARLEDERNLMMAQIDRIRREYDDAQRQFEQQKQKWYDSIAAEQRRREDEQFQQALRLYESIPPKQAQAMLSALVAGGEMNQAVAYFDAMNARAAAKIIREFKTAPETELAKDLLEALRTFGVLDADSRDSADERTVASASEPADETRP